MLSVVYGLVDPGSLTAPTLLVPASAYLYTFMQEGL
jgi:hypothetical protein